MLVLLFSCAIFASALLLFLVQPMFSKVVLPFMGGGAAVWTTAVLFFQVALLLGYLYAHLVATRVPPRWQLRLHAALLLASFAALPIAPKLGAPPPEASPAGWLLLLLTLSIGAPFLLLSTTSPLLQAWFARSGHREAENPYFLYAASNAGSLIALLAYPVAIEPMLTLAAQRAAWSVAYVVVVALVVGAGVAAGVAAGKRESGKAGDSDATPAPALPLSRSPAALRWLPLAFVPSAMMLAVTTYMTTDVAPVPLLWVVPLALYLLSFILAFARRPVPGHGWWLARQPIVLVIAAVVLFWGDDAVSPFFAPFHLLAFFMTAMVCHGELARLRPPPERLTAFYLTLSAGGALGGFFAAILAPLLFDTIAEYPWMVVAGLAVRPGVLMGAGERENGRAGGGDGAAARAGAVSPFRARMERSAERMSVDPVFVRFVPLAVSILALVFAAAELTGSSNVSKRDEHWKVGVLGACGVAALALFALRRRPLELAVGAGLVLVAGSAVESARGNAVYAERNFYGERTVREAGPAWTLAHGTTTHGMQFADSARRDIPLAYYHREGPVGELFRSLPLSPLPLRVAVVGLGTGALAAYGEPGDTFDFFEIDPAMAWLATESEWFSYLPDSKAETRVILGDGRLEMAKVPPGTYDLIFLDAFNSDAVPAHLLTREAIGMFVERLRPEGILAVHLSNRYLELDPVIAAAAMDLGFPARHRVRNTREEDRPKGYYGSSWAAVARDTLPLSPLPPTWLPLEPPPGFRTWTDDFSNVLSVFRWERY